MPSPNPNVVQPAVALAEIMGVTQGDVARLAAEGIIPKPAQRGRYDVPKCLKAYIAHIRENPFLAGPAEVAEFFDCSQQAILKWARMGMPRLARGRYDLRECARWNVERYRRVAQGDLQSPADEERAKLVHFQGRKAAIEAQVAEGAYVPAELAAEVLVEIAALARAEIESWKGRAAPEVVGVTQIGEARAIIEEQANRTLDRIDLRLQELVGRLHSGPGAPSRKAISKPNGRRVGRR